MNTLTLNKLESLEDHIIKLKQNNFHSAIKKFGFQTEEEAKRAKLDISQTFVF